MNELLDHPLLTAMGYALLHSVWVFGLLVLAGQLTARGFTDPARRHAILLAVLTALPFLFGLLVYLGLPAESVTPQGLVPASDMLIYPGETSAVYAPSAVGWLSSWLPVLSVIYLLGLLLAAARTTWAYHRMLGLRRGSLLPDPEWRDTYLALRRKLAPDCGAEWRWSATVNEVLTVGVWRPFILFPIGLVNDLSPGEVQAILRHELAHLRRRDHLWQALQQCVVTLFFYHPLVHWLCRRLDQEREFACDDLAARQIGPGIYARALLRVANYSLHPKIPFTVPATDQSSFTHRVHRLFESETSTNRRGGYLLAPLLSLPLFVLLAVGSMSVPTEVSPDAIITGTVVDAATGDPLIGTTILVKGTVAGTITDIEGNFRLDWNGEGEITVVFTYVGYVTKEIIFDNVKDRELDIQLSKQASYEKGSLRREEGIVLSDLPTNIIVVLDGRIIEGKYLHITASEIAAVKVIKDKAEMAELGYDTEMEGVMLITSKRE